MTKNFNKILREPLIHFLLLGFVLYLYYNEVTIKETLPSSTVEVSQSEKNEIEKNYKRAHKEKITPEQLILEVQFKLHEKILLQEAYRLNLDKEDSGIKKRLLQQMEFILNNSESFLEPTEEQLHLYYQKNIIDYSHLEFISFNYITSSDLDDASLVHTLRLIKYLDAKAIQGEKKVVQMSSSDVQKEFGKYFFHKLQNLKQLVWSKPINSKLGVLLVYIVDTNVSVAYEFEEVEDRIYNDYKREFMQKKKREAYQLLTKRYVLE